MSNFSPKTSLAGPPADIRTASLGGPRIASSADSIVVSQHQMYGAKLHPVLRDRPTGRHILSGKHRDPAYKQDRALLEATSAPARDVQNRLLAMFARADEAQTLNEEERRELATNVQFLVGKTLGDTALQEHIDLALVQEGDMWYRIDAKVQDRTIVQGRIETKQKRALRGLKRSVDELVYGRRREYLGRGS